MLNVSEGGKLISEFFKKREKIMTRFESTFKQTHTWTSVCKASESRWHKSNCKITQCIN